MPHIEENPREMSEQLVRDAIHAFMARDLEAILAVADREIVLRSLLTEAERPLYHGHEGVREWFEAVFGVFPDWNPAPRAATHDEDGAVVVPLDVTAIAAGRACRSTRAIGWAPGYGMPRSSSSGSSGPRRTRPEP
jgi:ketosteroid isomerase-like protein